MKAEKKMSMDTFYIFITTVELGSLKLAGEKLGVSTQTVSRALTELETNRQCQLFYKRKPLVISPVGERYYNSLKGVMEEASSLINHLDDEFLGEAGTLTIQSPITFSRIVLDDLLFEFCNLYPNIQINYKSDDDASNLDKSKVDIAFSMSSDLPSDWVAKKLKEFSNSLYASPGYIEKWGEPKTPEEVKKHRTIVYELQKQWPLVNQHTKEEILLNDLKPAMYANQMQIIYKSVFKDLGIAYLPNEILAKMVETGQLIKLLPDWSFPRTLHILYPHRAYLPIRARRFLDFMIERLHVVDYGSYEQKLLL